MPSLPSFCVHDHPQKETPTCSTQMSASAAVGAHSMAVHPACRVSLASPAGAPGRPSRGRSPWPQPGRPGRRAGSGRPCRRTRPHGHCPPGNPHTQPPSARSDRARDSASGPAIASSASNSRKVQTGGWAADTDADTSRGLTRVRLRPATFSSAPVFRLSARRVPFTMKQAWQTGLTAARTARSFPATARPYLQEKLTLLPLPGPCTTLHLPDGRLPLVGSRS
jgi:hypothetical protein